MDPDAELLPEDSESLSGDNGQLDTDQFIERLQMTLYRWDCPSAEELSDYRLDLVDAQTRAFVEQHLATCVPCREELSAFDQLLADETLPPERPTPAMGHFTSPRATPLMPSQPVTGTVRGGLTGQARFAFEGGITIYMEIEPPGEQTDEPSDHYLLVGHLVMSQEDLQDWIETLVEVWQGTTLAAITTIDAEGFFRCTLEVFHASLVRIHGPDDNVLECLIDVSDQD